MKKSENIKENRKFKPIDSKEEHNRVLLELGQLDDDDDWELYKTQENRFDTELDTDTYLKYCPIKNK